MVSLKNASLQVMLAFDPREYTRRQSAELRDIVVLCVVRNILTRAQTASFPSSAFHPTFYHHQLRPKLSFHHPTPPSPLSSTTNPPVFHRPSTPVSSLPLPKPRLPGIRNYLEAARSTHNSPLYLKSKPLQALSTSPKWLRGGVVKTPGTFRCRISTNITPTTSWFVCPATTRLSTSDEL